MRALPPKPIPFKQFGGLILNQAIDEVGQDNAIDLLDVDWHTGTLGSREGAKAFSAEGSDYYHAIFPHSDTRLIARLGSKTLVVLDNTGAEIAGKTIEVVASSHLSHTRMGTPTAAYTFTADAANTLKRYDGTSFTSPTATVDGVAGKAMPLGKHLVTWVDEENRLVVAGTAANGGPNGAVSSGSHVWFSEPGNAEGYESTSLVQLDPGDGEEIVGCCVWGGMVFVFKETRLFVFYGVSADNEGKPIFNFRTVDLGTRILSPAGWSGGKITVGNDGVYFVSNDGVWVTTGSEPTLLSTDLDPLARTPALVGPAATTLGERRWTHARDIAAFGDRIYVALGLENPADRLLIFDLRTQRWTVATTFMASMVPWNQETTLHRTRLFFTGAEGGKAKKIYFFTPEVDTDASVTMDPRWQSGFYDLEDADEKTLVDAKMWGTGEVNLKVAEDYKALGGATKFKLGVAPAIAQRQAQKGQAATLFSHQLSGTAPWSVQRLDRYLRETRVVETQQ